MGRHKLNCDCIKCKGKKISNDDIKEMEKINKIEREIELTNLRKTFEDNLKKNSDLSTNIKREIELIKEKAKLKKDTLNDKIRFLNIIDDESLIKAYRSIFETIDNKQIDKDEINDIQNELTKRNFDLNEIKKIYGYEEQTIKENGIKKELEKELTEYQKIEKEIADKVKKEEPKKEIPIEIEKEKVETKQNKIIRLLFTEGSLGSVISELQNEIPKIIINEEYTDSEKLTIKNMWNLVFEIYLLDWETFVKYAPLIYILIAQLQVNISLLRRYNTNKKIKEKEKKEIKKGK